MHEGLVDPNNAGHVGEDVSSWLEHLRVLMPPQGIAHVGAGVGSELAVYEKWTVPQLALIEADSALAKKLAEATKGREGWVVYPVLLDQTEGEKSFFVASNPRESGLLPAEALHSLWRNLRRTAERSMQAVSLDSLLAKHEDSTGSEINWLVVDCLPAATILLGAGELLKRCDVVVARVALRDDQAQVQGATLAETAAVLAGHGFARVAEDEERMPLVGRAIFVRRLNAAHVSFQLSLLQAELISERDAHAALHAQQLAALAEGQQASAVQLSALQNELAIERAQHGALQAAHHDAVESHRLAAAQASLLQDELAGERAQHAALQAAHHVAVEGHRLAAAQVSLLQDELTGERAQHAALQAAHHVVVESHRLAAARASLLQDELAGERAQHAALQSAHHVAVESHRFVAAELSEQQANAISAQQDHEKRVEDLHDRIKDLIASQQLALMAEAAALEQLAVVRAQMEEKGNLIRNELARVEAEVRPVREATVEREQPIQTQVDPLQAQLAAAEPARVDQVQQLTQQLEKSTSINMRLGEERNALVEFKTVTISKLMRLQTRLDEVEEQKSQVDHQAAERAAVIDQLEKQNFALTERIRLQAEELEHGSKADAEYQAKAERWQAEKLELEARLIQQVEVSQRAISELVQERESLITKLNDEALGAATRQQKFEIEMAKAEAQIGLIRELLLRPDASSISPT